jgi:hypothetical protein
MGIESVANIAGQMGTGSFLVRILLYLQRFEEKSGNGAGVLIELRTEI